MSSNKQIAVGQAVAVQSGYGYSNSFGWTVAKVTPKGQVVLKRDSDGYEMRFDADGYEMSKHAGRYHRARLITDIDAAKESNRREQAQRDAAAAINAVRGEARSTYGKESMLEIVAQLEAAVAAARAAVDAI